MELINSFYDIGRPEDDIPDMPDPHGLLEINWLQRHVDGQGLQWKFYQDIPDTTVDQVSSQIRKTFDPQPQYEQSPPIVIFAPLEAAPVTVNPDFPYVTPAA